VVTRESKYCGAIIAISVFKGMLSGDYMLFHVVGVSERRKLARRVDGQCEK
jgi:hypothetical protein